MNRTYLLLLSCLLFTLPSLAQKTWTGTTSTAWNTASNWSGGTVPTASDDVVIPDVTNDPVISAAGAVAKTVHVKGALLTILNAGSLTVNGARALEFEENVVSAFHNYGTVNNSGQLVIGNLSNVGNYSLWNNGIFNNNTGGQITINRWKQYALYNNSSIFTNAGSIVIGSIEPVLNGNFTSGYTGIGNRGTFNNSTSGNIAIDRFTVEAIFNRRDGTFTNAGSIVMGAINYPYSGPVAVENWGTFNNSGCGALLKVSSNTTIVDADGGTLTNSGTIIENASGNSNIATNTGTVQNLNGGTFTITNNTGIITTAALSTVWTGCTSTDWATASNWSSGVVPTASDDVVIPDVVNDPVLGASALAKTVEVQGSAALTILSTGSLTINGSKDIGVYNTAFSNLGTVNNSGQLVIGNLSSVGSYGLVNLATFNNSGGKLTLDRSTAAGLRNMAGNFTNAGNIVIGANAQGIGEGIYNQANFNNNTGGSIKIDGTRSIGLYNLAGNFINFSNIVIGSTASVGDWGIRNLANFTNNTGGEISVDRTTIGGVYNVFATGGRPLSTFTNLASLIIGATAAVGEYGIRNYSIINNTGGQITIDRSTIAGLENTGGTFTNAASIVIGAKAPVGLSGLVNLVTFINSPCASLALYAPFNNSSSFSNAGLFTVSTTLPHTNTGFINDGIISYQQGNPIPAVTNNKLIVEPISTACGPITPALQVGAANNLVVGTTWYKDAALTTAAVSYMPNTFTPTNLAAGGPYTVYFTVADPVNGCTKTIPIAVTVNGTAGTWYLDADKDGHYVSTVTACFSPGIGYNNTGGTLGDCDDGNADVWQSALLYIDVDGDDYNAGQATICYGTTFPTGYNAVTSGTDCNDNIAAINPGVVEICGNTIDDNCNGAIDENCSACGNATSFTTTDISSTSAQINWEADVDAVQWQVRYKTTNQGSKWIDVFVSGEKRTVTISPLSANQNYMWQIRAKCGTTWTDYSGANKFETLPAITGPVTTRSMSKQPVSSVEEINRGSMIQNYPNPFSNVTTMRYTLPVEAQVNLSVFNHLGQKITVLTNTKQMAGTHQVNFNASKLGAGIYQYQLQTLDVKGKIITLSGKMVMIK